MSRTVCQCLLTAALIICVSEQETKAQISNVRTEMTSRSLVVMYDLMEGLDTSLHRVDFTVVDNRGNAVHPDSVYGDLGPGILAGSDRKIVWEIYKEYDVVHGSFRPVLSLDPETSRKHTRGPEYASLSLLMPGLGDYFVADPKDLKIKPWQKTLFTAGVLGLSWAAWQNRQEIPPVMMPPGYYISADAPPGALDPYIYIDHEWMAEPARTEYWLFPHDAEIILGIGVASWLFDAIWVARRGVVNNRVHRDILDHMALVPCRRGLMLSYSFTLNDD